MRIGDVAPAELCRSHLLGEHRELHALWAVLTRNTRGYAHHPETRRWRGKLRALSLRHEALVAEMRRRGHRHASALDPELATGRANQDEYVTPPAAQRAILRAKGCGCVSRRARGIPGPVGTIPALSRDAAGRPGGLAAHADGEEVEMAQVEQTVEVDVPVRTAYDQWTQFEEFPRFMEGVQEVRQLDDARLHWRAAVAGKEAEWDAVITEQTPDRVIAWRSTSGRTNAGAVTFEALGGDRTRVTARIEYDPEGIVEGAGDALGFMDRRVQGDLDRFKAFIEGRGTETGAWRGEIHGEQVAGGTASD